MGVVLQSYYATNHTMQLNDVSNNPNIISSSHLQVNSVLKSHLS